MVLVDSTRPFFWILSILIVSLGAIVVYQQYQKITAKGQIVIHTGAGPVKINVEYAETPEKQKRGLMNRASLPDNSGMIFVFSNERIRDFWMKNTLIPLDIMYIGTNGHINEILTMQPCPADSACPFYVSKEPARFAIEVNAGFAEKFKITEGDILEISGF